MSLYYSCEKFSRYATPALLAWEYCITLDDEMTFFWVPKISSIQCLFFMTRYLPMILGVWDIVPKILMDSDNLYDELARSGLNLQVFLFSWSTVYVVGVIGRLIVIESILILRVWAMSGRRKSVLYFFPVALLLNFGVSLFLYLRYGATSWDQRVYWIPMLVFEIILFTTAVGYGLQGMKVTQILARSRHNFGPKPIMGLLLRDSVFYFVVVAGCYPVYVWLNSEMGLALTSIPITRMLLRLRKRAAEDLNIPATQDIELETLRIANSITEGSLTTHV
ncbi:uncharacterized protein EV420DRAFT_1645612 [Desarmillaria tabescens]|uniref:DUF6533 domain-containing protein n=1 Tax=Armillaria tabescens TaxID=1929756 RepID=A0AA39N0K5_ARMTA|nr:uncharacterized protein EV420DRAFT_1645612 [Desarmillaria tabescens]KAK0452765.1 hypothetical protein EV420DRAFT_1645612 [Desarmillaria tabescens]